MLEVHIAQHYFKLLMHREYGYGIDDNKEIMDDLSKLYEIYCDYLDYKYRKAKIEEVEDKAQFGDRCLSSDLGHAEASYSQDLRDGIKQFNEKWVNVIKLREDI